MAFCTPEGGNGTPGKAEGAIFPEGVQNPWTPSQRATIVVLYLGNMNIPWHP